MDLVELGGVDRLHLEQVHAQVAGIDPRGVLRARQRHLVFWRCFSSLSPFLLDFSSSSVFLFLLSFVGLPFTPCETVAVHNTNNCTLHIPKFT